MTEELGLGTSQTQPETKKFLVTQEIILERHVEVEAEDQSQADEIVTLGGGETVYETESSWATTLSVEEIDND